MVLYYYIIKSRKHYLDKFTPHRAVWYYPFKLFSSTCVPPSAQSIVPTTRRLQVARSRFSCSTSRRHLDSPSPSCPQSPSFLLQSGHLALMSHHAHFVSQAPGQPFALTYSAQSRYWHGLPAFSHSFMSRWLTNHCSNSQPAPMSMSITMNQPTLTTSRCVRARTIP